MNNELHQERTSTIIQVDRSTKPVYPHWVGRILHPELEASGPPKFDLTDVELWLHPEQRRGNSALLTGKIVYEYLRDNDMLKTCLGLAEGLAIQAREAKVFERLYQGKPIFLLQSVAEDRGGLWAACLIACGPQDDRQVVLGWDVIHSRIFGHDPVARFRDSN